MSEIYSEIPKQEFAPQGNWYLDDDQVEKFYSLVDSQEISKENITTIVESLRVDLNNLFSIDQRNDEEELKVQVLGNMINKLSSYVDLPNMMKKDVADTDIIDLGDTSH